MPPTSLIIGANANENIIFHLSVYMKVGGRLRCIGSSQHLKTRFGNHLELEVFCESYQYFHLQIFDFVHCPQVKPTEVSYVDLENLCRYIQERLFHIPHPRSILSDLEVCIGGVDSITSENASVSEISLSPEMIVMIGRWLGNEERISTLVSSVSVSDGVFGERLSEQLFRDGMLFFAHFPFVFWCQSWYTVTGILPLHLNRK